MKVLCIKTVKDRSGKPAGFTKGNTYTMFHKDEDVVCKRDDEDDEHVISGAQYALLHFQRIK